MKKLFRVFAKDNLLRIVLFLLAVNLLVWLFRPIVVQHRRDSVPPSNLVENLLK